MKVPNKLVKKTIYARINEVFVQFSWRLHISANEFSEGTHPIGEGACRNTTFFKSRGVGRNTAFKKKTSFLHIPFFAVPLHPERPSAFGRSGFRLGWFPSNTHSNSLPVNNDGRTTVERRWNDGRAKIRQYSNGSETAVTPYHNVTSVYYKNLLQTVLNGQNHFGTEFV